MVTYLRVLWARMCGFLRPDAPDREFMDELESHLAMAEEDYLRRGLSPKEARRRARIDLGGLSRLREAGRDARGLPRFDSFILDVKLSLRMLRKSWGLTLVGGLAMALAMGIGLMIFWFFETALWPTLPLDEGDRVVAIQTWDDQGHHVRATSGEDFERWHKALSAVEDYGAFRTVQRNVEIEGSVAQPVSVAEMTASGFQLARIPPMLGRTLVEADERDGADPVVVLGYDVWSSSFAADPDVVGRTLRLAGTPHTVVGVMPRGFAFPVNHRFWTPLRIDPHRLLDKDVEAVIFARLAEGVTLEQAQAELTALGHLPTTTPKDDHLRPRVVPYAFSFLGDMELSELPWFRLILVLVALLLVPPCANIAILVYARTITRQEELAARFTLGASRGRIVVQLFLEVLVLALGAAIAAILLTGSVGVYLRHLVAQHATDGIPFWIDFSLSYKAVLFACGLAVVAAAIAGLVPAFKATGPRLMSGLSGLGNRSSLGLGGTWTVLVVAQVALTLASLPSAVEMGWGTIRKGVLGPGFPAEQYLTAQLDLSREPGDRSSAARFAGIRDELARRLKAEPGIRDVTLSLAVAGEEPWTHIEVKGHPRAQRGPFNVRSVVRFNRVDEAFFQVLNAPLLAGRGFDTQDFVSGATAVIVNQTFARQTFGDESPLGRRLRYTHTIGGEPVSAAEFQTWYEIVGVVTDRPANPTHGTFYHPVPAEDLHPVSLSLHTELASGAADSLRRIAQALDPDMRVQEVRTLDEIYRENAIGNNLGALTLALVTLSVLLLSAAGIYALMSFTVNRRRREIGIRSALGAPPHRVLMGIFRRAAAQVGTGAVLGASVALALDYYLPIEEAGGWEVPGVIPATGVLMVTLALLAAAGPARRGLRVDPIDELREG